MLSCSPSKTTTSTTYHLSGFWRCWHWGIAVGLLSFWILRGYGRRGGFSLHSFGFFASAQMKGYCSLFLYAPAGAFIKCVPGRLNCDLWSPLELWRVRILGVAKALVHSGSKFVHGFFKGNPTNLHDIHWFSSRQGSRDIDWSARIQHSTFLVLFGMRTCQESLSLPLHQEELKT